MADLTYLLLEDGSEFLYNPATEARPTSVDGLRIVGDKAGPHIQHEEEDYDGPRTRALVNAALTAARVPAAEDPEPAPTASAYQRPASHFSVGEPEGLRGGG